ncbi:MAG: hypothetical protein UU47_C0003G0040 [candidate division TM6 bacterium GW2011_GWE2_41_16]|nr:MAG: hypothetical protein UU47_C0003G0040 [candidate division TM6 bacterium GW2011_GWE2_41_16]
MLFCKKMFTCLLVVVLGCQVSLVKPMTTMTPSAISLAINVATDKTVKKNIASAVLFLTQSRFGQHMGTFLVKPFALPLCIGAVIGLSGLSNKMFVSLHHHRGPSIPVVPAVLALCEGSIALLTLHYWGLGKFLHLYPVTAQAHFKGVCKTLGYSALWWTAMTTATMAGEKISPEIHSRVADFYRKKRTQAKIAQQKRILAQQKLAEQERRRQRAQAEVIPTCPICAENLANTDIDLDGGARELLGLPVRLPCGHSFHTECIKNSHMYGICPVCKQHHNMYF